jgi:hypothetical protein
MNSVTSVDVIFLSDSVRLQTVRGWFMEEPGEQCTVVFAVIVTEQASECVFGGVTIRFRFRNNYAKTTVHPDRFSKNVIKCINRIQLL